jgi:predicted nucleic acid-binding protein
MAILLDTNILLRLLQPQHPHSLIAEHALTILRKEEKILNITQQNLVEFWAVITRPKMENGLGVPVEQAIGEINTLKRLFVLLPEIPIQDEWERLVATYRVCGKNTHDARLVAAMLVHGVDSILTFNAQDFTRYAEISVLDPLTLG